MREIDNIAEKLDEKIEEGSDLREGRLTNRHSNKRESAVRSLNRNYEKWFRSTIALLEKIELRDQGSIEKFKSYYGLIDRLSDGTISQTDGKRLYNAIQSQISILEGIKEIYVDIEPIKIKKAVAKGVYDNELDEAQGLLEGNHVIASAAITRSVLEDSLEKLCAERGLNPESENIDKYAQVLWKEGPLSKIEYKQISSWAEVGHDALHEKGENISPSDVAEMIENVRDFVKRFGIET